MVPLDTSFSDGKLAAKETRGQVEETDALLALFFIRFYEIMSEVPFVM
jgi:hypothetical protein